MLPRRFNRCRWLDPPSSSVSFFVMKVSCPSLDCRRTHHHLPSIKHQSALTNTSAQTMTAVSFSLSSIVAKNGIIYFQCISLFFHVSPQDDATSSIIDPLIIELQSRVADLELAKEHTDVSAAVQRERAEILIRLRKIMETMKSETGGVGGASSSKEIEQLKAENKELKRINAKQRYRIDHLVNNLRETMK